MRILFAHDKENPMYSETFIKAQLDLLPHDITYICVKSKYDISRNGRTLFDSQKLSNFKNKVLSKVLRKNINDEIFKENFKVFKSFKPDVILAQYGIIGMHLVDYAKELNCKLVVHFHGYDSGRKDILNRFNNYKDLWNHADATIAVSKAMYSQLLSLGAPEDKLFHSCYGINTDTFDLKKEYNGKQLFAVGRFTEKKAPQITLYAFSLVLKEIPDARLIMAGDGPLYDICFKLAQAMKINHAVTFLGAAPHDLVSEYMNNSLIFVQHSLVPENGDTEGTPLAVLEAMSTGLPVVSTKHAGIMDVVKEDETGYLVEEMDAETMALKIIELINDNKKCKDFGKKGRQIIQENYKVSRYIDELSNILEKVVQK